MKILNAVEIKPVLLTSQEYYTNSGQAGAKAMNWQAEASMLTDLSYGVKQER